MKQAIVAAILVLALSACNLPITDTSPAVVFQDKVLETRVLAALKTQKVTETQALKVKELDLSTPWDDKSGSEISNLNGLEYFQNLEVLRLSRNAISDLAPLSGLTALQVLDLYGNDVADLSPLAGLTSLIEIDFWANRLKDLGTLAGLGQLQDVNLGGNPGIKTIAPLKNLKNLQMIWLNFCSGITDADTVGTFASAPNLDTVGVMQCNVANLDFVKYLPKLQTLGASYNKKITTIDALKDCTELKSLFLDSCSITDVSLLKTLYDNGCFRASGGYTNDINLANNNCDFKEGSANRSAVDTLVNAGRKVEWQEGNITK